jgi:hypothetical protein
MTMITLTKMESALLQGLLFAKDSETKAITLTAEDRELAAELLRNFVGQLTYKLLGTPIRPGKQPLALPDPDELDFIY